jgi:hypothetical protein
MIHDANPPPSGPEEEDEFLKKLRLDQNYLDATGAKKVLTHVPVRKPKPDEWFRCHPTHFLEVMMLPLKAENEVYFLPQSLASTVPELVQPVRLRLCVSRQGVLFLCPVRLPKGDRRPDAWRVSQEDACSRAEKKWVRMAANMGLGAYEIRQSDADWEPPKWPDESFGEVVKIALKDRLIETSQHVVIREMLGFE